MSGKNTFKIFPQRNKRNHPIPGPSSQPLHPSTSSTSSESRVPRINITSYDPHGLPTESYTEPTTTNQVAPSNDSDPKKSESFVDRMFKKIHRKLSLNRSGSSTSNLVEPSLHSQPSNDETALPPAPLILEGNINNSRERSETYSTRDNGLSVLAQLERGGINVPPLLEPTIMPSASSGSDRKKVVIGAMRLILQNAALTLKFAPIPNLDAIPNLLLTWLQVYETVGGNDEGLKGLDDEIRGAYTTILRPLQLWTDQIPPDVVHLIKGFHLALEEQIHQIESLKGQGFGTRVTLATEISERISAMKACISKAVNFFLTEATTLTLLHAIETSAQAKLERLVRVAAEHTYVKSKSKCLPNTRDNTQRSILNLLKEAKSRFVWLRGSPGTGKTAISMSIASALEEEGTLAASFFWDKNQKGTGLDSLERFPSTLARQLALFDGDFKVSLIKCLRKPDSELVLSLDPKTQMKTLVLEPMNGLEGILSGSNKRVSIILDGLDECGDPEALESLMELVLLLHELPSAFAVLVSCRPEPTVLSAWNRARGQGLVIPCEDMDRIEWGDNFHTIRRMVEEELRDCITGSPWKPSDEDLDVFVGGCRGLPIMASIRIRDVCVQTRRGSSLQLEFEYFRSLREVPTDLNWEYLRIMRRAYLSDSSRIRPHVAKNYREIITMIITAEWKDLGTDDISHLLGITEHEVRTTLTPISSIVDLPESNNEQTVKFYHATVKEFIMGVPIGEEQDKVFFVPDVNGYSIGLQLLRFVNDVIRKNEFDFPTELPLGDRKKWQLSLGKQPPRWVFNAFSFLFKHLDPLLLFSRESNELNQEFEIFLTRNLFSFILTTNGRLAIAALPSGWYQFDPHNHKSMELLSEAQNLWQRFDDAPHPRHLYRSGLPFTPSSLRLSELYGHFSDPVQVFSISGEFSSRLIPLSEDAHRARRVMETKLSELRGERGREDTNYEIEFTEHDIRNGVVTCAALSRDGCCVALGFGSGVIEVADVDNRRTIFRFQRNLPKPPVWIEFVQGSSDKIVTEDTDGNITILGPSTSPVKLGTLASDCCQAVTGVSNDGSFILRAPQNLNKNWYENVALLCFSSNPSVQLLASPTTPSIAQSPQPRSGLSVPQRQTIGFSPGGLYVGAYDMDYAFVWSTHSHEWIAQYCVHEFKSWILNAGLVPPWRHRIPEPVHRNPAVHLVLGGATHARSSEPDIGHDANEAWLKCPFYDLSPSNKFMYNRTRIYSSAVGRVPLAPVTFGLRESPLHLWFNGDSKLIVPPEYHPVGWGACSSSEKQAWYGDLVLKDDDSRDSVYFFPRAGKDGTRFLLQGKLKAPVVVDIGQVA